MCPTFKKQIQVKELDTHFFIFEVLGLHSYTSLSSKKKSEVPTKYVFKHRSCSGNLDNSVWKAVLDKRKHPSHSSYHRISRMQSIPTVPWRTKTHISKNVLRVIALVDVLF